MKHLMINTRKQGWLLLLPIVLAVTGVFGLVQPAAAMPIEVRELVIRVVVQEVDTDGDGRLEPVSAFGVGYEDGSAEGRVNIGHAHNVTLKRGVFSCEAGVDTAVLEGTLYKMNNGTQIEVGEVTVRVSPANGNTGGRGGADVALDFDVLAGAALLYDFEVQGTMFLANPPCG